MASLFSARRKPKRITRDNTEDEVEQENEEVGTAVRRPNVGPKTKSKLRISFDPSEAQTEETSGEPKALQKSRPPTSTRELPKHTAALHLSDRLEDTRPSYNRTYLEELRNSTPSTPRDISHYNSSTEDEPQTSTTVDIAAKFGHVGEVPGFKIPSAAEIQEKKDRRARLAKEHAARSGKGDENFIALEDYDSDGEFKPQRMQVGNVLQRHEEKDTRLVHDDEDFAEGFEDFTEDGSSRRILMSRKAQKDEARKEQEAKRELIEEAESGEDDEIDSDDSLRHAYESAQTHRGMDGLDARKSQQREAKRPRQPDKITPINSLSVGLARIRELAEQSEAAKEKAQRRVVEIEKEQAEVQAEQARIQASLTELGKQLELAMSQTNGSAVKSESGVSARGLESFGGAQV